MTLTGTLVGHVEISAGADVFHELYRYKPHEISSICPDTILACDLISGEQGVVGSVICWTYMHDGQKHTGKDVIEEIDETNHKIVFKVIEGDILEVYTALTITFHVEPKDGKQLATWTFEFEKLNESVPDPTSAMELLCGVVKDIDVHSCSK